MNQYGKSRFGRFFVYCCELVGDILGRTLAKGFEKILNIGLTRYRTYLPTTPKYVFKLETDLQRI